MHLALSPDQARLARIAKEYAATALAPRAAAFEESAGVPSDVFVELGARGLMAVHLPRAYGGTEAGVVAYALAMMEIGAGCASTAVTMAVTNMVGEVILAFANEAEKSRYLPALAAGALGAFALSESGAGSDPGAMRTRATRDGDDFVIEGEKQWISHGDIARVLVVWARTGGEGARGISAFLVDGSAKGLECLRHEDKLGLRASRTAALTFDAVRVPSSALLGRLGDGFRIAMAALDGGRIGIGSQAIGIAEGAFERVRRASSPNDDVVREGVLADARARLDAARLLALRAARSKERKTPFTLEASIAKVFATETAVAVCRELSVHQASYPPDVAVVVDRALRDARVTMIYEGTSEVQRVVIARERGAR
jgi:alkylation response protein AidB-like acyl-CoA dehydrogenase